MVRLTRQAREREQRDEQLSAYLDDQLSAGERARLEARLATDPALQAELDALRHTVAVVRDLPPIPVPRNFILPQTVAARARPLSPVHRRRAWSTPLLTAATAVVSLLFVVVLAGDLWLSGMEGITSALRTEPLLEAEAPQPQAWAPSPIDEGAEVEKAMPVATALPLPAEVPPETPPEAAAETERYGVETPEGVESDVPAAGGGPVEQPAASPGPPQAEQVAAAPTVPVASEDVDATALGTGGGGPGEEPPVPALVPSPTMDGETTAVPTGPVMEIEVPVADVGSAEPTPGVVGDFATEVIEEMEPGATEGGRDVAEGEAASLRPALPWRVLEVILGLTALGLALTTVWAWRARRG
jgi:hypothetical protein